jgi:hypothetical protein
MPGTFAQAMNTTAGGQHLQTGEQSTRYPRTAALVDGTDVRHGVLFVSSPKTLKNDNPVAHMSDPEHCNLRAMDAPTIVAIVGDSNVVQWVPALVRESSTPRIDEQLTRIAIQGLWPQCWKMPHRFFPDCPCLT